MAASSSSAAAADSRPPKYDVFISFRGETRKGFTSHLYKALSGKQIDAYIDEVSLEKGDAISRALPEAIKESEISIIIFSEKYAESRWCLDELVHILKRREEKDQIVLAIFYNIDPSHIRHQKETYAAAFVKHEERFEMEKVQKWRQALKEAADLSGWDSRNMPESEIVEEVVELVKRELDTIMSKKSDVWKGLVGIPKRLEKIKSYLDSPAVRLGIWGMGGHPLALKVLGASVFCFLESIEDWEKELKKLKRIPNDEIQVVLKRSYNALDAEEKGLFLDIACFLKGKRRDFVEGILEGKPITGLVNKSLITIEFGRICMHDLIQEMGRDIVCQSTDNLGERSRLWIAQDVSFVLENNKGTEAIEGIYLPWIEEDEKLHLSEGIYPPWIEEDELHLRPDVFEEMCKLRLLKIYDPRRLSRKVKFKLEQLWDGVQKFGSLKHINLYDSKVLTKIPDLSLAPKLESINLSCCLSLTHIPSLNLQATFKDRRQCLRDEFSIENDHAKRSPGCIILSGCESLRTLPKVSGNITRLVLSESALKELPSSIESLDHLLRLDLDCCYDLKSLPKLPRNIEVLVLDGSEIEQIPSSIACHCSIQILSLRRCRSLTTLPSNINLKALRKLNLVETLIQELPSTIENSIGLRDLYLDRCEHLEFIPETLCKLTRLQRLFLRDLSYSSIREIPASIGMLYKLKTLDISYCKNLQSLPELPLFIVSVNAEGCSSLEMVSTLRSTLTLGRWLDKYEDGHNYQREFSFLHCTNLGEDAINKIFREFLYKVFCTATTPLKVEQTVIGKVVVCYPTKEIPRWFNNQSEGSSITVTLPPNWYNPKTFLGFVVSVIVVEEVPEGLPSVECILHLWTERDRFRVNDDVNIYRNLYHIGHLDHIVMWYNYFDHSKVNFEKEYTEASFEFETHNLKVKWCGVRMLYLRDAVEKSDDVETFFTSLSKNVFDIEPKPKPLSFCFIFYIFTRGTI
ncbi:hypothetical protein UlMin_041906 [Ulmus minor]